MTDRAAKLGDGALARRGLLDADALRAAGDLLEQIAKSDLETIRVVFADQHGILRGKTIVAGAAASLFTSGMAATSTLLLKDTSHRTVFPLWTNSPDLPANMSGAADILMVPDPHSFRVLPWSPQSAWIFCEPRLKSGEAIRFSPQHVLQTAISRLAARNLRCVMGLEVEFHVFEAVDTRLDHADAVMPGRPPQTRNLTQGYQYLTETRYDAAEGVLDALRRDCQALGLPVRSMEIEMGPSQFEFTFDPADPVTQANNMVMFRTMVKETCARRGLHATFMCRPNVENAAASGWHIHQSVVDMDSGANVFMPDASGGLSQQASGWIAGVLDHAAESCALTTPTVNGYKRYRPHQLAPDRIQWGRDNRGAMVRALIAAGDPASRVENRVAEPAANPFYCFASQILSGLDGIERGLAAPDPVETPYDAAVPRLPGSLLCAIQAFSGSQFYRQALGDDTVDYLTHIRQAEWDRYHMAVSDWEQAEYFGLY